MNLVVNYIWEAVIVCCGIAAMLVMRSINYSRRRIRFYSYDIDEIGGSEDKKKIIWEEAVRLEELSASSNEGMVVPRLFLGDAKLWNGYVYCKRDNIRQAVFSKIINDYRIIVGDLPKRIVRSVYRSSKHTSMDMRVGSDLFALKSAELLLFENSKERFSEFVLMFGRNGGMLIACMLSSRLSFVDLR